VTALQPFRNHRSVESSLHFSLDVTFAEDASRIRERNGPTVTAAFRRMGLFILKSDTTIKGNI
jgi:predicted transposase YbfD/YdcC